MAYAYPGYYWHQGYAYYAVDSTIPSSWSTAILFAKSSWNNAGSGFRFYSSESTNNKLYYAGLGSSGPTAKTYTTYSGSSILKNEIYFNNDKSWSISGAPGCFDVKSVAVHEFGHWLYLDDLYSDTVPVMYGHLNTGQVKQSLTSDDIAGIKRIYP